MKFICRTLIGKSRKKMWQFPWQYRESVVFVLGIVIIGLVLQLRIGRVEIAYFNSPVNIIAAGLLILSILLCAMNWKNPILGWFSSIYFSVTLLGFLLALTLIMGLTPQWNRIDRSHADIFSLLGFRQMISSWPFVLIYLLLLFSLGCLIVRRLMAFRRRDYAFYLNHIGLWMVLFFSAMGAADMRRYVMHVMEGEIEWRVYSENGDLLELPIAIQLNDFDIEEYPPKLLVIDRNTGEMQPLQSPDFFHIDEQKRIGIIDRWEVTLLEYIHHAIRNSDSSYREINMPGSSPAAKITVKEINSSISTTGWVCGGNSAQLYMALALDSLYCVVMTKPEPKQFISDINIFTEDGKEAQAVIKVNQPYKTGFWSIYQYGYDNEAGRLSSYSSFELVYDPWIWPVYVGIILLAFGSICMLWSENKKGRRRRYDME